MIEPLYPTPHITHYLHLKNQKFIYISFLLGLRFIDLDMDIPPFSVSGTEPFSCSRAVLEICSGVEPIPGVLGGEPRILNPLTIGGESFRNLEAFSGVRFPCFNDLEEQGLGVRLNLKERGGDGLGVRLNLEEKD